MSSVDYPTRTSRRALGAAAVFVAPGAAAWTATFTHLPGVPK